MLLQAIVNQRKFAQYKTFICLLLLDLQQIKSANMIQIFSDQEIYDYNDCEVNQNVGSESFDLWLSGQNYIPSNTTHSQKITEQIQKNILNDQCSLNNNNQVLGIRQNTLIKSRQKVNVHLSNKRRKKDDRQIVKVLSKIAHKFSRNHNQMVNKEDQMHFFGQTTKNLLAFAKYAHFAFIKYKFGKEFIHGKEWLKQIYQKIGMTLQDYNRLYNCQELKSGLNEFFNKKVIYRELMLSRTVPMNKIFYLYSLDIFEMNYRKRKFKGISETKLCIQKERKKKQIKKLLKNKQLKLKK